MSEQDFCFHQWVNDGHPSKTSAPQYCTSCGKIRVVDTTSSAIEDLRTEIEGLKRKIR